MERIDNDYIEKAIETIFDTIGIKDCADKQRIISFIHQKRIKEGIKEIAKYLGLPVEINISYVPRGYRADNTNTFHSTHLVKIDRKGSGSEGITAQVSIPNDLPMYGSLKLNNFPISVKVSENCTEKPTTFIAIMAHELSHIVLHSLWHKEKDNEIYTDITAMMLGFSKIIKDGRKVVKTDDSTERGFLSNTTTTRTQTTTYGYLSDVNFNFALNKIEEILNNYKQIKNKLINKIDELNERKRKNKKKITYFQKYLEYIDKNLKRKISQEDGYKILTFHQVGYLDEFDQAIRKIEDELKQFNNFVRTLNYYNKNTSDIIKQYEEKICDAINEINSKDNKLQTDINILKNNISFWYKLKIFVIDSVWI